MLEHIFTGEGLMALLTLTFLEIVLGIDNIIFISIVTNKLPEKEQPRARTLGLALALIFRVAMLLSITWIMGFDKPLFVIDDFKLWGIEIQDFGFSGRDAILLAGGIFLLAKSTSEIFHKIEGDEHEPTVKNVKTGMANILTQIVLLDIVFSFDSILTAIGMTKDLPVMIAAVTISIIVMMLFAGKISAFINKHPSLQILALAFLIMIGFMLVLDAFHEHVPKGYIYSAIVFSLSVELINMRVQRKKKATS
jgi:predicted tellurium resistance membrane protein TerC